MKFYRALTLAVFLVCSFVCGVVESSLAEVHTGSPDTLKIGVIQSLTGIAAQYGQSNLRAIELAAEDLNSRGGEKVELLVEDDGTSPRNSVSAWQRLMAKQVDAVIGSTWDFCTNPLLPLAGKSKVPLINVSVMPEALELQSASGFGFTLGISTAAELAPLERFINVNKIKSAVVIAVNNAWGAVQATQAAQILKDSSVRLLENITPSTLEANDWGAIVPKIQRLHPDLVVLLINPVDINIFLRRAREVGLSARFFGANNTSVAFHSTDNPELYEGICFPAETYESPKVELLRTRLQEKHGVVPDRYFDTSYDSVLLLSSAFTQAFKAQMPLKDALVQSKFEALRGEYQYDSLLSFSSGKTELGCIEGGQITHPGVLGNPSL